MTVKLKSCLPKPLLPASEVPDRPRVEPKKSEPLLLSSESFKLGAKRVTGAYKGLLAVQNWRVVGIGVVALMDIQSSYPDKSRPP